MTPFDAGSCEGLKLATHRALEGLAAAALAYNAIAFARRRETHLAVNVLIYGCLVAFEGYVCQQHSQRRSDR